MHWKHIESCLYHDPGHLTLPRLHSKRICSYKTICRTLQDSGFQAELIICGTYRANIISKRNALRSAPACSYSRRRPRSCNRSQLRAFTPAAARGATPHVLTVLVYPGCRLAVVAATCCRRRCSGHSIDVKTNWLLRTRMFTISLCLFPCSCT